MISCDSCGQTFPNRVSLGIHRAKAHPSVGHICSFCKENFQNRQALYRHRKKCSPQESCSSGGNELPSCSQTPQTCFKESSIICGYCKGNVLLPNIFDLISHLQQEHKFNGKVQEISFENYNAFEAWRKQVETGATFEFVRVRVRNTQLTIVDYFYCHRSGVYESQSDGTRLPKDLGSIKCGFHCSVFAFVTTDCANGKVTVKCCLEHYIHDTLLARIHLPEEICARVGEYKADGRTIDDIVKKIQSDYTASASIESEMERQMATSRQNMITRLDIHNIITRLGLRRDQHDQNDLVSVQLLVESHAERAKAEGTISPFFYFQPQMDDGVFTLGSVCHCGQTEHYKYAMTFVGIQTAFQIEMFNCFGNRAICVDATHGTNRYKFYLVTVLVVDDFGKGFPIAWLITSNETEDLLHGFFSEMKQRVVEVAPQTFMSDDAPQYWNAWTTAFTNSPRPKKLLCTWHVLRNWDRAVKSKVSSENVDAAWTFLDLILREPDHPKFQYYLTKFLSDFKNETEFIEYFKTEYCKEQRITEWAYWARRGSIVSVNMFLEAFHRVLKERFLNRRENNRVDTLIHSLLDAAKWYLQEYYVSDQRGSAINSYRKKEMHKRHKASYGLSSEHVSIVEPGRWSVKSATNPSVFYEVSRINQHCDCRLRCSGCKVCPDLYTCSCPDALFGSTACKHAHLVHGLRDPDVSLSEALDPPCEEAQEESAGCSEVRPDPQRFLLQSAVRHTTVTEKQELALSILASLSSHISSITNPMVLDELIKKFRTADTYAIIYSEKQPPQTEKLPMVAPNKRMATQRRFYQVKKRRVGGSRLPKPDGQRLEAIREAMDNIESSVCGICHEEEDPQGDNTQEDIPWVACDLCSTWFHQSCTGVQDENIDSYVCAVCK